MQRRAAVSFQWKTAFKKSEEDVQEDFAVKFSVENKEERMQLSWQRRS